MLIRRTYRLLAASIAFTFSHSALAIGVGDIVVNSYVNEPLSADIAILDPKDLSESEVIASLASLADFDRLGIERHYSLGDKAGAKDLLETAISMGDETQVEVAQQLLASIE